MRGSCLLESFSHEMSHQYAPLSCSEQDVDTFAVAIAMTRKFARLDVWKVHSASEMSYDDWKWTLTVRFDDKSKC